MPIARITRSAPRSLGGSRCSVVSLPPTFSLFQIRERRTSTSHTRWDATGALLFFPLMSLCALCVLRGENRHVHHAKYAKRRQEVRDDSTAPL